MSTHKEFIGVIEGGSWRERAASSRNVLSVGLVIPVRFRGRLKIDKLAPVDIIDMGTMLVTLRDSVILADGLDIPVLRELGIPKEVFKPLLLRKFEVKDGRTLTKPLGDEALGIFGIMLVVLSSNSLALTSWEETLYTEIEPMVLKKQFIPLFFGKYDTA